MIIDQADFGGNVSEYLGLPFASVSILPPFIDDNRVPPFFFDWPARYDLVGRIRNEFGILLLPRMASPIFRVVNRQRNAWGLRRHKRRGHALSPILQITQMPHALEFDGCPQAGGIALHGPFSYSIKSGPQVDFPWNGSMVARSFTHRWELCKTVRKRPSEIIAEGCANLDVQLVMSLGGGFSTEEFRDLPGQPDRGGICAAA